MHGDRTNVMGRHSGDAGMTSLALAAVTLPRTAEDSRGDPVEHG